MTYIRIFNLLKFAFIFVFLHIFCFVCVFCLIVYFLLLLFCFLCVFLYSLGFFCLLCVLFVVCLQRGNCVVFSSSSCVPLSPLRTCTTFWTVCNAARSTRWTSLGQVRATQHHAAPPSTTQQQEEWAADENLLPQHILECTPPPHHSETRQHKNQSLDDSYAVTARRGTH